MTKLERLMEQEWRKAHGSTLTVTRSNGPCVSVTIAAQDASRKAAAAARVVRTASDEAVFALFMERASAEKRARSEALVSNSANGLANSSARMDAISEQRLAVTAKYNAIQMRPVQLLMEGMVVARPGMRAGETDREWRIRITDPRCLLG
jgi:hypothetical protein